MINETFLWRRCCGLVESSSCFVCGNLLSLYGVFIRRINFNVISITLLSSRRVHDDLISIRMEDNGHIYSRRSFTLLDISQSQDLFTSSADSLPHLSSPIRLDDTFFLVTTFRPLCSISESNDNWTSRNLMGKSKPSSFICLSPHSL